MNLLQSAMNTKLATNQIEISVITNDAFTNGDLAYLQLHDIVPMAWSPLAGGALFNDTNANLISIMTRLAEKRRGDASAIALAWLWLIRPASFPLLGQTIRSIADPCLSI